MAFMTESLIPFHYGINFIMGSTRKKEKARKKGKKERNNKQNSKYFFILIFLQLTITKRNRKTIQEITDSQRSFLKVFKLF